MPKQIYQIQIALVGFKPKIWRRILVPSDLLLSDFHLIIQTTMGWYNCHLHHFIKNKTFYSIKVPEDDFFWNDSEDIDYKAKKLKIADLLKTIKDKIKYEYDFGDSWEHDIILENILPFDDKVKYPVCIKGKMNCPPKTVAVFGAIMIFSKL
ncbi:MAG: plasmid pRiA4b ORF-3 family protein [Chitinophagales bacterium]